MKIGIGFKAHSGWAALVALGTANGRVVVVDRHRVELADLSAGEWARQPYHAADGLPSARASEVVRRGIDTAKRMAVSEMKAAITRARLAGHRPDRCAVLVGTKMPAWSVDEILAVHFRMHQAEGALYRDALIAAARSCRLKVVEIPERRIGDEAARALRRSAAELSKQVAALRTQVGAPWGKDQKDAALAAMVALA
jgi:hypothetical protein